MEFEKLKIGIVGLGIIGEACKYGFEKLGHDVFTHDTKFKDSYLKNVFDTDIVYICVPTPSNADGSCDTSIVESVINELIENHYSGVIAIKSTVKPTTTERLIKEHNNKMICFIPEFLRERCAITDFIEKHDLLAIGSENSYVHDIVIKCHGSYPKHIKKLKPTEAELLKYYSNCFNALRVVFANEMYEVCKNVNADYTKIKNAFILRGTTTDMYLDVNESFRGYAGVCLPKDTAAMAAFVDELGIDMKLFETLENENAKFKKTVFEGMRL